MKQSIRVAALAAATLLCRPGPLSAQPTVTGINIWNVPIDVYLSTNQQGSSLIINDSNCPGTAIIRSCMQQYLASWHSQGASTVRFFLAMTVPLDDPGPFFGSGAPSASEGNYSHPWLYNGGNPTVQTRWLSNLLNFLTDVKNAGMSILPTLSFDPGGPYLYNSGNQASDCAGQGGLLMFYRWVPYGFEQSNRFDDGQGINTCYSGGSPNPYFWGWGPFQSLFGGIVGKAAQAHVTIQELDIMQERNLYYFTIDARLIYDNAHSFDVLGFIRSTLATYGLTARWQRSPAGHRTPFRDSTAPRSTGTQACS